MAKHVIILLMTAFLFSATCATAKELEQSQVTVASYNIRHGADIDFKLDLDGTASVLQRLGADVIALQEVDAMCARSGSVNQPQVLGEKLGMHSAFGKFMDLGGGEYGMAILSKFPILQIKRHKLPTGAEPRIALEIVTEPLKGKKVSFVCIHFDWTSEARRQPQIKALQKALAETKHPVVLLGDFNAEPDSPSIALFKAGWKNIPKKGEAFTFPANAPNVEIDYIMTRGLAVSEATCRVLEEPRASDHRPLRAHLPLR